MNTLIVFNHPYGGSFCGAILAAVERGLKAGGHKCRVINLDQDDFDPVMRSKDLLAFVGAGRAGEDALDAIDDQVREYKEHLEWAEHLVMIFPIWWMTTPAMTKGFIDKVIFPAIAYDMKDGRLVSRLSLRKVTVITTMNTPADIYREVFGNPLEGSLIKGTFRQIGIENIEWTSLSEVKQVSREQREAWLEEIERRFAKPVSL
ncbi:MAG: NAD(P)H-dependent oxidoreductase [Bacteroidales bacterium]|nr:NAD(P)H-dependent oxidoreductase [Bacteroidales bacterium]